MHYFPVFGNRVTVYFLFALMVIGNNLLMFFILYLGVRKLAFDDTFLALLFFVRLRNFAFVHNGNVVLGLYDMLL